MAGERGSESTDSGASGSATKPKVFIVGGTPNSNKRELAINVMRKLTDVNLMYVDVEQPDTYALGDMADYRGEVYHAFRRLFAYLEWARAGQDIIVSNSLLDSMAWIYTNTERRMENGVWRPEEAQTNLIACAMVANLCKDSFYADHVFLVYEPEDDQDEEHFYKQRTILRTLGISYTILDSDTGDLVEACAKIIREFYAN